uniref:Uncharacterized protein n=1 Tax=Glossina pallidipes TaxID=7398 RepID=A0A1B0ADY6_GLOPL
MRFAKYLEWILNALNKRTDGVGSNCCAALVFEGQNKGNGNGSRSKRSGILTAEKLNHFDKISM